MDSKYHIWDQVQFHHRCLSDILLTGYTKHFAYVWRPLIENFVALVAVQPLKKLLACSFFYSDKSMTDKSRCFVRRSDTEITNSSMNLLMSEPFRFQCEFHLIFWSLTVELGARTQCISANNLHQHFLECYEYRWKWTNMKLYIPNTNHLASQAAVDPQVYGSGELALWKYNNHLKKKL
jgi:hypothetical protein